MFDKAFLDELADAISERINKNAPARHDWPALMDLKTAGEYMCRSEAGVRSLIRTGQIPSVRGDARMHIRKTDIDAWAALMIERIGA